MTEQHVVQISNLTYTYKKVCALDYISLNIPSGQVGIVGPDGVGKSTLLSLIAGARKLQQGTLQVLGGDMSSGFHRKQIGPKIAFMPQGLGKNLYQDLSVSENLIFFGKLFGLSQQERDNRIKHLTQATGLYPFLNRPMGKLSGGMKQKLGLCCALIHDPDLLILDEPTTGVDPLSRRQFWELIDTIQKKRPNMSIVISTAYMDEAERFEFLIAMDSGKILATGSPSELKYLTKTDSLEHAFVKLLPNQPENKATFEIPQFKEQNSKPAIIAQNLTRRFGDFTAVDQVSFEIKKGEIFGFLGSNGCGKTTTMKMLTGLLPASEGEAYIFGNPVDAKDIATRKRVGFMSQSFSLYGELTVLQNLKLHARLFHLSPERTSERIEYLVKRFKLETHINSLASSLPLGIRQRLSLSVAIIHEPEILILDEPTSGVDPIARDEFWELLVEISRKQKVTIFISTHFMNEALRCDRISLMHAGKVLVYDKPENIVRNQNTSNLEEAFIKHIEDAQEDTEKSAKQIDFIISKSKSHDKKHRFSKLFNFNIDRLLAYSIREITEIVRDPVRLGFAFFGSIALLVIMAYGINMDVEKINFAVLDLDKTPESRTYIRSYFGSPYFREHKELQDKTDLERRLVSNDISLALEIPPNFGHDIKKGNRPEVSAWIDGSNTTRSGTIVNFVSSAHTQYLNRSSIENKFIPSSQVVSIEARYRYNPSFESIYAMGPSVPAMLLLLFPAILMAVSIAREKEIGTIINFYVTPTTRLEFLLGKQVPYIAIGMINFLILTFMVIVILQVPLKGSSIALTCGAFLYIIASTGFGLLISSLTKSQVAAVFATAILSMLPTMQFSGMIQPVSTLEGGARIMGTLWPTTYYMHLSVGTFTKGLSFNDLLPDLIALLCFAPAFIFIAMMLLRKQEV